MRKPSRRVAAGSILAGVLLGVGLLSWMQPPEENGSPNETELTKGPSPKAKRDLTVRRRARPVAPVPEHPAVALTEPEPVVEVPTDGLAPVIVDVVDEDGRPAEDAMVMPIDCEGLGGGPPGEYQAVPGTCTLRAVRRDGALFTRGPEASVEVGGSDPAYIQLLLTGRRKGGIGIRFAQGAEGMRVMEVVPGSPAHRAGLEAGDLILAVGGEDVAGMGSEQFVEQMTGTEGTDVEFTLGLSSDTGVSEETLRVTRAFLEG